VNRVLLIEDNVELAAGIEYNLVQEGMEVRTAESGEEGLALIGTWRPTVIILDLMLPGMDGFSVLQDLRRRGDRTPVLILSARAQEADLIRGFRLDADQYMTKPFGLLELIERVKSLLRRGALAESPVIRFGDVEIDSTAHTVTRGGEPVSLTPREFKLLLALAQKQGRVVSRLDLLREVWGHRGVVMTRTVDAHVKELRRKLEADPAEPRHIITVWKVGYRFEP
jgi:two-component system, OmpR family, alkaline phosphatase synthesis response regulator PhoP